MDTELSTNLSAYYLSYTKEGCKKPEANKSPAPVKSTIFRFF